METASPADRHRFLTPERFAEGLDALAAADPDIAAARAQLGDPVLRQREPGFGTLLDVIVGQQLSTASAGAIRGRVRALVHPLTPRRYLATPPDALLKAGLSRQKLAYSRDLAAAALDGRVAFDRLHDADDETAIERLVSIKGIGRWTAEIYLLFALGRPDVWPAEDLALQVGLQQLKQLETRPRGRVMRAGGDGWRPWRGVAAHFLWHVYHHVTRRVAVPIEAAPREPAIEPVLQSAEVRAPVSRRSGSETAVKPKSKSAPKSKARVQAKPGRTTAAKVKPKRSGHGRPSKA